MKRPTRIIVLVVLVIVLAGVFVLTMSDDDEGLPDQTREQFLAECRPGGGELLCRCVVDELEDELTLQQFRDLARDAFSESPPAVVENAINRCLSRL